jgi:hypothetical protein
VSQSLITSGEPVQDRRSAYTTKAAKHAGRRLIECDEALSLDPTEVILLDPNAAAERRAVLLPAIDAMTVERATKGAIDLELYASAEAASAYCSHQPLQRLNVQYDEGPRGTYAGSDVKQPRAGEVRRDGS